MRIVFLLLVLPLACLAGGDSGGPAGPGDFQGAVYRHLKRESGYKVVDRSVVVGPPSRAAVMLDTGPEQGWSGEVRAMVSRDPDMPRGPAVFCYFLQNGRVRALALRGSSPWCP